MSGILSGMETITVRDLQKNLKRTLARVEHGTSLQVTRRRQAVAQLGPVRPTAKARPWPDLRARAEAVLGKRRISPGAAAQIVAERGPW